MSIARLTEIFTKAAERITDGLSVINTDHAAIHKGMGFTAGDYISMTTGAVKSYCLTAPASKYMHIKNLSIQALGGSIKLEILKLPTVTVNTGTALVLTNKNDNSAVVSGSSIKPDPTFSDGTVWDTFYALSDSTNQSTGLTQINDNDNEELVTKAASTKYIIRLTNLTEVTVPVSWRIFFYEEDAGAY